MSGELVSSDPLVEELIEFGWLQDSARDGWYYASCLAGCDWGVGGTETVVLDAAHSHVDERHRHEAGEQGSA